MPEREPLTESVTLTLTQRERALLEELAYHHGATLRGFIRKLIRDAAQANQRNVMIGGAQSNETSPR